MEIAIKWIYQQVTHNGVPLEAGQKPSLCFLGRKHMLCVVVAHPVRVLKRKASDWLTYRPVVNGSPERPYTIPEAVKRLREIAGRCGITEGARKLLDRAEAEAEFDADADEFRDEEQIDFGKAGKFNNDSNGHAPAEVSDVEKKTKKAGAAPKFKGKTKVIKAKKPEAAKATKADGAKLDGAKLDGAAKPKAKSEGPRPGTVAAFIVERLKAGKTVAEVAEEAGKKFPDTSAGDPAYVSWHRWNAGKKGWL